MLFMLIEVILYFYYK